MVDGGGAFRWKCVSGESSRFAALRGNNHEDGCTCQWCSNVGWNIESSGGGGLSWGSAAAYPSRTVPQLDAMPAPNARCPVCGAPVYFPKLENGGRVYFDALGPPWPKHPCTDNSTSESGSRAGSMAMSAEADPRKPLDDSIDPKDEWTPVRFISQRKGSGGDSPAHSLGWTTVRARNIANQTWERWLVAEPLELVPPELAYRSTWNLYGEALLSYLALTSGQYFERRVNLWSVARFSDINAKLAQDLRGLDPADRGMCAILQYLETIGNGHFVAGTSRENFAIELDRVAGELYEPDWQTSPFCVGRLRLEVTRITRSFIPNWFERVPHLMTLIIAFY